ncbi:TnsA endonuclease N-terminal domain-containing protein [Deinococcus yunweiensis]|uniref:TnsA endonuclease N-terminal domain-containing protein n=1 Tax=Deinococcus yunweiensis TaxID=367282 RepID=UPI00398F0384
MAKRNRGLTKDAIQKRWKAGHGQGEGKGYKPWLTIQSVPSQGQVNRPLGWKTGRVHHLMSLNELHYFYLLEWSPLVTDIREQFPLWPAEETEEIAQSLNIRHPAPPGGGPMVMSSDFMITLSSGQNVVRTMKEGSALSDDRTIEKLDIEREYWRRRGVDWGVVVADDLPMPLVQNVKWLHPHLILDGFGFDANDVPALLRYLTAEVLTSPDALATVARRCDDDLTLNPGSCLTLARHLIATRQWQVDLTVPINSSRRLTLQQAQVE